MHSKWSLLLVVVVLVTLLACGSPGKENTESPEPTKDPFGASTGGAMGQPGNKAMSQMQNQQGVSEMIYITSPDKTNYIILVPDPEAKTNFKVAHIGWVKNGVPQKKPGFNYSDLSEGDIFWAKYAGKYDIKVRLNKSVSSWEDLLSSDIISVLEHDLGRHNNIKMTTDWYFTKVQPMAN